MFIRERVLAQKRKNQELRCAEQEDEWHTSEAGPIGLFIGKGLQVLGLTGERQRVDGDKRTAALRYMAEKHILESDELDAKRTSLLRDVFVEGILAIVNNQGLGTVAQSHDIPREECLVF